MPVSATFGNIGTILYLVAILGVTGLIIAGPVHQAFDSSGSVSSGSIARGVQEQIDALHPGMAASMSLQTMPGTSESVTLSGNQVTATVDGQSTSMDVDLDFAGTYTMSPGHVYVASYSGGSVVVSG